MSQEKEMRALLKHQIRDEKNLQSQQQNEQLILLKSLQGELLVLHKQQCIEEDDLLKATEDMILQLLHTQQNAQVEELKKHHQEQKKLWVSELKRAEEEINPKLDKELKDLQEMHTSEFDQWQNKLSDYASKTRKQQDIRLHKLEEEMKEEENSLEVLHLQQRNSKLKQLAERQRQQALQFTINSRDGDGQTALHIAASTGDFQKAFRLIKDGIEINLTDKNGWTALHCACYSKQKQIVSLLLDQAEIDVSLPNDSGSTSLHYFSRSFDAANYNEANENLVSTMLKKGGKINAKNANGEMPLHNACFSRNLSVVRVLIQNGADINQKTGAEETCLHYATRMPDSGDLVTFLLQQGVDPTVKGKFGTALDIAKQMKNAEVETILKEAEQKRLYGSSTTDNKQGTHYEQVPADKMVNPTGKKEEDQKPTSYKPIPSHPYVSSNDDDDELPPYPKALGESTKAFMYSTIKEAKINLTSDSMDETALLKKLNSLDVPAAPSFENNSPNSSPTTLPPKGSSIKERGSGIKDKKK